MGRKSPSERGYHPVMLRRGVFERLQGYAQGGTMSAAVERLLDSAESGGCSPAGEGGIIHLSELETALHVLRMDDVIPKVRKAVELMGHS